MTTLVRSVLPTRVTVPRRNRRIPKHGVVCTAQAQRNWNNTSFAFRTRRDPNRSLVRAASDESSASDDTAGQSVTPERLAADTRDTLKTCANGMRVKQLKSTLGYLGISSSKFFEKGELVNAVVDAWQEKLSQSTNVPLRQIVGMPGNPRAGYVLVTLDCGDDAGFVDFLIDTGATTALISPKLRETLGDKLCTDGAAIRGLGSMGETIRQKTTITGLALGSLELNALDAVVTDLSATGLPSIVGGMLGLDFLKKFETEFDFTNKTLSFHKIGTVGSGAVDVDGLVEVPLQTHPTGLKYVKCRLNAGPEFSAIVDAGSFFSVANWLASASGGISPDSDGVTSSAMTAVGVDGRSMTMSTAAFDLEVLGVGGVGGEEKTSNSLKSSYKGQCCIGDLPAFVALGAETSPFMSMGLDVLGRGRTVFDIQNDRLYLTPGDSVERGYGG